MSQVKHYKTMGKAVEVLAAFKTEKNANRYISDNPGTGVLAISRGMILISKNDDSGEKIKKYDSMYPEFGIVKITDNQDRTTHRYSVFFDNGYRLVLTEYGEFFSDCWKIDWLNSQMNTEVKFENLPEPVQRVIKCFYSEQ